MARVEPPALENHDLARVYIAGTLREAKDIEELLTGHGINYVVQVEPYRASILFGPRNGAAFYVTEEQAIFCRAQLASAGFHRGLLDE
jgi:hypothetical protein